MRILVVSPMYPPQPGAGALRVHAFAQTFASAGEQVTVLTTAKRSAPGSRAAQSGEEVVELEYRVPRMLERLRSWDRAEGSSERDTAADSRPGALRRLRLRSGAFCAVRMPDLTGWWIEPAIRWAQSHVDQHGPYDVGSPGTELEFAL